MIRLVLAAAGVAAVLAASPVFARDGHDILLGSGGDGGIAAFGLTAALLGGRMMVPPIVYPAPPVIYAAPAPPVIDARAPVIEAAPAGPCR